MKKFLSLCLTFLFSTIYVFASDIKFVQIDNLKYNPMAEESVSNFTNTIDEINKLKDIDFVIFSGNNIAKSDEQYLEEFLKKANKLHSPYYVALGHKDLNKKKGLSKNAYMRIVRNKTHKNINNSSYVFNKKGVTFIVADGAKEFIATPFGYYRDSVINYVDRELRKHSKSNAVILQHFPIYPPDSSEKYRTYNVENYIKILGDHTNLKAVISGFGINSENEINGIKHITTADYPKYRIIEIIDCKNSNPTIWTTLK